MNIQELATIHMGFAFRTRLETDKKGVVCIIKMRDLCKNNTVDCSTMARLDMHIPLKDTLVEKHDMIFKSRGAVYVAALVQEQHISKTLSTVIKEHHHA